MSSNKAIVLAGGAAALFLLMGRKKDTEDQGAPAGQSGGWTPDPPIGGTGASVTPWWLGAGGNLPTTGWGSQAGVPLSVIERMTQAVATQDPTRIRAVALELNIEGYNEQAEDLLRAADLFEAAQQIQVTDPLTGQKVPVSTTPVKGTEPGPNLGVVPLRKGSKGPAVTNWQMALRAQGFGSPLVAVAQAMPPGSDPEVKADAVFGPATDTATRLFQTDHALSVDGIVGPKTTGAIGKQPLLGRRLLKLGKRGPAVKVWQAQLIKDGAGHVKSDGVFGPVTDTATREWQRARKLQVDGAVGPKTIAAIGTSSAATTPVPSTSVVDPDKWRVMRRGTAGKDVAEWQMILNRDGYGPVATDGKFGPATEEATKQWQSTHKLTPDGVVGPNTRNAIEDGTPGPGVLATRVMGDTDLQPFRAPREFKPYSPLPGLIPLSIPTEVVPADRSLAARFAQHLFNVSPGAEDRDFVREFQRAHGLNDSGAYGPSTALALVPYGIVPAKPFYWPRKGLMKAKAQYRVTLMQQSTRDPQRRDEWSAAANV